jgi:hypothetical protein
MTYRVVLLLLVGCLVAPLAAQAPEGLRVRVDESVNASDPDDTPNLKVVAAGKGFRVTGGPAGTFWKSADTATGNYTLRATFTLMKPSGHTNYYGLVFGGSGLDRPNQSYTYFLVAQDGTYQIRQRDGEGINTIRGRTQHEAVRRPAANGQSTNALEVRVAGNTISYVVNGTVVHTTPKANLKTDGLAGVRVNHLLDVQVDAFEIQRP